jgi:hypothetical protein
MTLAAMVTPHPWEAKPEAVAQTVADSMSKHTQAAGAHMAAARSAERAATAFSSNALVHAKGFGYGDPTRHVDPNSSPGYRAWNRAYTEAREAAANHKAAARGHMSVVDSLGQVQLDAPGKSASPLLLRRQNAWTYSSLADQKGAATKKSQRTAQAQGNAPAPDYRYKGEPPPSLMDRLLGH